MNTTILQIAQIVELLKQEDDLHPRETVNTLFARLVVAALDPRTEAILHQLQLPEIHSLCAQGETCLECYWSERIMQAIDPLAEISTFPYIKNYEALAQAELSLIRRCAPHVKKALFVGSGPLPLSTLLFEKEGWFEMVHALDADKWAVQMSNRLFKTLGSSIRCFHNTAENFTRYQEYDLIFVAALVGMTNESKQDMLRSLKLPSNSYVAVRSVEGSRQLLYPRLSHLPEGYLEVGRFVPDDEVINTLILSRVV